MDEKVLTEQEEQVILRKIVKALFKRKEICFADAKRDVGNMSSEIKEDNQKVAMVMGKLLAEIVSESFKPENYEKGIAKYNGGH